MTLIRGRISGDRIEVGADGLSTSTRLGGQPGRTTLQKLFPMASRPVAIAQVGDNSIKRHGRDSSLSSLVREALATVEADHAGMAIHCLASRLADYLWNTCESGSFTLWQVAFETRNGIPSVFRIDIQKSNGPLGPVVQSCNSGMISDGSGKRFVNSLDDDLYDTFRAAIFRQEGSGEFSFGGHWHSLEIVPRRSPEWIRPPRSGTLGLSDLLDQRDLSRIRLSASPQEEIAAQMSRLKNALRERARTESGEPPRSILGCKDHWERGRTAKNPPDWDRVFGLVAIGDEANVADSSDVSDADALLYREHVSELLASLPPSL